MGDFVIVSCFFRVSEFQGFFGILYHPRGISRQEGFWVKKLPYLTVQILAVFYFFLSRSPSLVADNHGVWVGLISCLAARNLVLNFLLFVQDFHREKTFKCNKKTPVYKFPRGAIYKPPCVQLINNTFFAIHQVSALSTYPSDRLGKGFESQNPHFPCGTLKGNRDLFTQSTLFWGDRKGSFLTPKPSSPDFGGFDPCKGSADSQK